MPDYRFDNIFSKIIRREAPSHQVYEDETTLAFMDIMPRTLGHTLVIPKIPVRDLFDVPPAVLADLMVKTQRVAIAARKAMKADGMTIHQFSEASGGQIVFHLHFHVLPRFAGIELKPHSNATADHADLEKHAALIRAMLA